MTNPRTILKANIESVIEGINHLSVDDAADLLAELAGECDGRWRMTARETIEARLGRALPPTKDLRPDDRKAIYLLALKFQKQKSPQP